MAVKDYPTNREEAQDGMMEETIFDVLCEHGAGVQTPNKDFEENELVIGRGQNSKTKESFPVSCFTEMMNKLAKEHGGYNIITEESPTR